MNERQFVGRAIDLAEEARDRGDEPFGSVLGRNGEVVMEERNAVVSENDVRRHPELHIAMRAFRELDPAERSQCTMYTSTEPCPMCAGGLRYAGFDRIVYSVSLQDLIVDIRGLDPLPVDAEDILAGVSRVEGPVLGDRGRQVVRSFYST